MSSSSRAAIAPRETAPCALCGTFAELCLSHVVPEALYEPTYVGKGTDHWTVGAYFGGKGPARQRKLQKGWREPLLCLKCEKLINENYEQPTLGFWRYLSQGGPLPEQISATQIAFPDRGAATEFRGVDYRAWKLCLLSIFWRASVAKAPIWSGIEVGPKHERILREMILHGDPGSIFDYPCWLIVVTGGWRMIAPGSGARLAGHRTFQIVLPRVMLSFFASSHVDRELATLGPSPEGLVTALHMDATKVPMIRSALSRIRALGPLPPSMKPKKM